MNRHFSLRPADRMNAQLEGDLEWVDVGGTSDLLNGGMVVGFGTVSVVIISTGRGLVAVEDVCPHLGRPLSEGRIAGRRVQCAGHAYRWDLVTGQPVRRPGTRLQPGILRRFPIRAAGDRVLLGRPKGG